MARGITLEFTLEERFVSRWTRRSRTIYRRTGFIGSKFNGYLVPIPIQCAPWSNEGFPLMMGKRFADPFHDPESWKGKIEGVKGGIRDKPNLRMQNRSMRCLLRIHPSSRHKRIFIDFYLAIYQRFPTKLHPIEGGTFINTLGNYYCSPPSSLHSSLCAKPRQARVINFVINHCELRVFVHVLLDAWCARRFCPPQLFEWRECRCSNIIESINFTAISDSQYRRFHLPRLFAFHHYDSLIFGSNVVELT